MVQYIQIFGNNIIRIDILIMKIFLNSKFRLSSEPFLLLIKHFNLNAEIVQIDHHKIKIVD